MPVDVSTFDYRKFCLIQPHTFRDTLYFAVKRTVDIVLSSILLILLSPLLILIAVWVAVDSPGPILYVQERVGCARRRRGDRRTWCLRTFNMLKFRSMHYRAGSTAHREYIQSFCRGHVRNAPEANPIFKLQADSRITGAGKFLRKTSLDELPQLLNVLRGEMSLVGPRPVPTYEVEHYPEHAFRRYTALPGITGVWQVYGRSRVPFAEMLQMDIHYAEQRSYWLDAKLLWLTLPAVVSRRGAA